ncbi:hypothetical protein HYH03_018783 [Edaphochlamys debaryana]|uniref:Uncharacterized protein n=2 Tax=Edaphochlamys debaryana TaxID=47281 RepID=A0A835XD53_9CHLO|nr:hypothetical protein HYH03_018783 [Edaphochlamys debaryana]|eukprot:KAG2482267.1 hypothetical protein HYH03_018783 [Edaphochlamys debaryana]
MELQPAPEAQTNPLVAAVAQLDALQAQLFLAGPESLTQTCEGDASPAYRLACDVLACTVHVCEVWRAALTRRGNAAPDGAPAETSTAGQQRMLAQLLASLYLLDCLKDFKQPLLLRAAAACSTSDAGGELLSAVQEFIRTRSAGMSLLRDLLLEDASTASRAKTALLRLLTSQVELVESTASGAGLGASSNDSSVRRGTASKAKQGSGANVEGSNGPACAADSSAAGRSAARMALSGIVYLYCSVDAVEQEHLALQAQNPDANAASGGSGATPAGAKAAAAAAAKVLRAAVTALRATPVVPGYGDMAVDVLKPLQGLRQLAQGGAPWDDKGGVGPLDAAASEERYALGAVTSAAALDYGVVVEELMALRLRHEAAQREATQPSLGRNYNPVNGSENLLPPAPAVAPSQPSAATLSSLSRAAAPLATRALHLLQDWQSALLHLDAYRNWQRRQQAEEKRAAARTARLAAAMAGVDRGEIAEEEPEAPPLSRCAFQASDMPDVVRLLSYIKGLSGLLREALPWIEPLLAAHCAAHLNQMAKAVVAPLSSGLLGLGAAAPTPEAAAMAALANALGGAGNPLSAPSSARGGGPNSIFAAATEAAGAEPGGGEPDAAKLAVGLGRLWKAKAHARASLEAKEDPTPAASEPPPEVDQQGADAYSRLRDWFAGGPTHADADLGAALYTVPEGLTPRSEISDAQPAVPTTAGWGAPPRVPRPGDSPSAPPPRGSGSGSGRAGFTAGRTSTSGRMQRTPRTEGTESAVDCTVSSDGEGEAAGEEAEVQGRLRSGEPAPPTDLIGARGPGLGMATPSWLQRTAQQPVPAWPGVALAAAPPLPPVDSSPPPWSLPPAPGGSWLDGNDIGFTSPQAAGLSRLAAAGAPLATNNPLFVYSSISHQVQASQPADPSTVAIMVASEGGGTLPAPTHIAGGQPGDMDSGAAPDGASSQSRKGPGKAMKSLRKLFGGKRSSKAGAGSEAGGDPSGGGHDGGPEGEEEHAVGVPGYAALAAPFLPPGDAPSGTSVRRGGPGSVYGGSTYGYAHIFHQQPSVQPPQPGQAPADWAAETAAVNGAVALLSIHPSGAGADGASMGPGAGKGPVQGGASGKGTAAFLDVVARAREDKSAQRLRHLASEVQACLAVAGFGTDGSQALALPEAPAPGGEQGQARSKGSSAGGAKALKWLVTSFRSRGGARQESAAGAGPSEADCAVEQQLSAGAWLGLGEAGVARLRASTEAMAEELDSLVAQRRARGKAAKDGPSLVQLLALTSELRLFIAATLPVLEPLLAYRTHLDAASSLAPLLLADPTRPYHPTATNPTKATSGPALGADARGSVAWELVHRCILGLPGSGPAEQDAGPQAPAGRQGRGSDLPLAAGVTVLSLFHDAVEGLQAQQIRAVDAGYPEAPAALGLCKAMQRQARWALGAFVDAAARRVWSTYLAQALRSELGAAPPCGPEVAANTASFYGLFRLPPHDPAHEQLQALLWGPGVSPPPGSGLPERLSSAVEELVRQAASGLAEQLLGSDLTALAAVKQQLDVLSAAVARLRRELPSIRPWADTWLSALAARAASARTCTAIAEPAAATAAAVAQGCDAAGPGLGVSTDDIILTHVCSAAALRSLSTWSYDMTAVQFRPTKHTKTFWESAVGAPAAAAAAAAGGGVWPGCAASCGAFGRVHVVALQGLLGLDGVGRLVGVLKRHAVELLADAAPLLRRIHDLYDGSVAGPRGPGLRGSGGPSGFLQLQQRWLRDRGHNELLVSAHRALQALGNTVAAVALVDSVLAEQCAGRAQHLLPLVASAQQADQQAHAALQAMALAEASSGGGVSLLPPAAAATVPPPPPGVGLAGLLLGQPLPPGLASAEQPAVQAAALVQERLQKQLPPAFGLPGLYRALLDGLCPATSTGGSSSGSHRPSPPLFAAPRLWCVIQLQLSCLSPEEQAIHAVNVGEGVYVAGAALVQLAAGSALAPGSALMGDTMTALQQAVALEATKAQLAAAGAAMLGGHAGAAGGDTAAATMEALSAWASRAREVQGGWQRAVQLTVGAGTAAEKAAKQATAGETRLSGSTGGFMLDAVGLEVPPLTSRTSEPWAALAFQAASAGLALIARAAAPPPQAQQPGPHPAGSLPPSGPAGPAPSIGPGPAPGPGVPAVAGHPGLLRSHSTLGMMQAGALVRGPAPSRPPLATVSSQPPPPPAGANGGVAAPNGVGLRSFSAGGPPLPGRGATASFSGPYSSAPGAAPPGRPGQPPAPVPPPGPGPHLARSSSQIAAFNGPNPYLQCQKAAPPATPFVPGEQPQPFASAALQQAVQQLQSQQAQGPGAWSQAQGQSRGSALREVSSAGVAAFGVSTFGSNGGVPMLDGLSSGGPTALAGAGGMSYGGAPFGGVPYGSMYGTPASQPGSVAAQSRSRAGSSLGDWVE